MQLLVTPCFVNFDRHRMSRVPCPVSRVPPRTFPLNPQEPPYREVLPPIQEKRSQSCHSVV
jgi:hypothetical protein